MTIQWFRSWDVSEWTDDVAHGSFLLASIAPQWTHLRTYVSWYIESWAEFSVTEPVFVGVYAYRGPEDPPPDPPNPAAVGLSGDWWRGETHYGQLVAPTASTPVQRAVWPAGGSRLWDIETNRRPLGSDLLSWWLVWAGPDDVLMPMRASIYKASLIDDHDLAT